MGWWFYGKRGVNKISLWKFTLVPEPLPPAKSQFIWSSQKSTVDWNCFPRTVVSVVVLVAIRWQWILTFHVSSSCQVATASVNKLSAWPAEWVRRWERQPSNGSLWTNGTPPSLLSSFHSKQLETFKRLYKQSNIDENSKLYAFVCPGGREFVSLLSSMISSSIVATLNQTGLFWESYAMIKHSINMQYFISLEDGNKN